jgi:hypothetical protein
MGIDARIFAKNAKKFCSVDRAKQFGGEYGEHTGAWWLAFLKGMDASEFGLYSGDSAYGRKIARKFISRWGEDDTYFLVSDASDQYFDVVEDGGYTSDSAAEDV